MEAPEKLYISGNEEDFVMNLQAATKKKELDSDIEYTRTDAFIEKASTWFADRYQANGSYLCADDIEDFRNYMKG